MSDQRTFTPGQLPAFPPADRRSADERDEADFRTWLDAVDRAISSRAGVSRDDLADQPWRDWFEDGAAADQAAVWALEEEGFYDDD